MVQIGFLFLVFFGIFVDHYGYLSPTNELQPHEINLSTNILASICPMGFQHPFLAATTPADEL
jgi:hypothetical protein